jgi:ribosomal protein S25
LFEGLEKRLAAKKSIDNIADELCPGASKGRDKVVKLIKTYKGGQYLVDNYIWLGYNKDKVRNPTGKRTYHTECRKNESLFRASLSTRKPSDEEYKNWSDSFAQMTDIISRLTTEFKDTTEGRYIWKLNELKKRTIELDTLLKGIKREKPKYNKTELHRKIFEIAKEQINQIGNINVYEITDELKINISTTRKHIKKMNRELESLIKKWKNDNKKEL